MDLSSGRFSSQLPISPVLQMTVASTSERSLALGTSDFWVAYGLVDQAGELTSALWHAAFSEWPGSTRLVYSLYVRVPLHP